MNDLRQWLRRSEGAGLLVLLAFALFCGLFHVVSASHERDHYCPVCGWAGGFLVAAATAVLFVRSYRLTFIPAPPRAAARRIHARRGRAPPALPLHPAL